MQNTFAAGELSPALMSRVDLPQYAAGCRALRNFIVHSTGAISNRPGTKFIAEVKDSSKKVRLVRFVFSTTQAYVIEFGNLYCRFYKDDGQIVRWSHFSGITPVEIATPYTEADLPKLKFAQSADVLFIAHPNYAPRALTRYSHTNWVIEAINFKNGPFMLANLDSAKKLTPSATSGEITLTSNFDLFDAKHVGALFEINHYIEARTTSGFLDKEVSVWPMTIRGQGSWRLVTHGEWAGEFHISRSFDGGSTWQKIRSYSGNKDKNYDITGEENGTFMLRITSDITEGMLNFSMTIDEHIHHGVVKIKSVTDARNATATVVTALGDTATTDNWAEGSWSDYRGWPSVVGFFEDRLCFAANANEPQTIWMSQTSDYDNFGISNPMVDTDRLTINLVSRDVQNIRWMIDLGDLLTFTNNAIWTVGAAQDAALTPSTVGQKRQDAHGSADVEPVAAGNEAIYLQTHGTRLRRVYYSFESYGYKSTDLSIFASHLLSPEIVDLDYQREPDSIVWMVRSDGVLIGMTYVPEYEMAAWHRHDTDGEFENICVLPVDGYDELWAVVKRTIGGQTVRYIERFAQRKKSTDSKDWFFVDSGLSYEGNPADEFSGLDHLEGKKVAILADGAALDQQTVTNGEITLPVSASNVHIGLPYVSEVAPMGFVAQLETGTTQAMPIQIQDAVYRFENSLGGNIGPEQDWVDVIDLGATPFTGLYRFTIPTQHKVDGTIWYKQDKPLPVTIIAILPEVSAGG